MTLKLHLHPLASYCWKVLIAFYEKEIPFEPVVVDLMDEASRSAFLKLWPLGKMPVLQDEERGRTVPESSIIIEYIDRLYPASPKLIPSDHDLALEVRLIDRLHDLYVQDPMQRIVADRLRPAGDKDALGVRQAHAQLRTVYGVIEERLALRCWAAGEFFSLADCAAMPALYYADKVLPFAADHPKTAAYLARLLERPSVARVLREAQPFLHMFPTEDQAI